MKAFDEFLAKYFPEGNRIDGSVMYGYAVAQSLVQVLKQCGDNLTRENIMKQAANIKDLELDGLLPGIKVNTSPTDFAPISAAAADASSRARPGSGSARSSAPTSAADAARRRCDLRAPVRFA